MSTTTETYDDDSVPEPYSEDERSGGKSSRTKFLQGAVVFVAMFAVLWWLLSRNNEQPS